MATKLDYRNPDQKEEADQRYAPRQLSDRENDIPGYDRANDGLDDHPINSGDASGKSGDLNGESNTKNIDNAKQKEEDAGPWKNSYQGQNKKRKLDIKGVLKKKGPLGFIITLLVGGGGMTFVGPGILVIDFKEKMINAYNDQLGAMDQRTSMLIKKKFSSDVTRGRCAKTLTINCRFETVPDKKFQRMSKIMEENGGKLNKSGETLIKGRAKFESIEFKGEIITAKNFDQHLRTNPEFRGAMMKTYNPKLAGFADALFAKLATKLGINKQKNVTGKTDEERQLSVVNAASGESVAQAEAKVKENIEDCSGGDDCVDGKRRTYTDEITGKPLTERQYQERIGEVKALQAEIDNRKKLTQTGKVATKAGIKGALTSTALGLGAVDTACTGYTLIRVVSFAAKYIGALQMLRFVHTIYNTGDSAKALEGDSESMEYIGKVLTTPNSEGKTATDAYGYKMAVYGDVSPMPRSDNATAQSMDAAGNNIELSEEDKEQIAINDETTKYINGQLVSTSVMAGILRFVQVATTKEADEACKFVKSGWGQTILIGGAIVGAVAAFFSGGATLTWGVGLQVASGVAFSVALALLTPKLIEMASATMIGPAELSNGNRAGNAATSGAGAYNHETSMNRGVPALKVEDARAYEEFNQKIVAQYKEVDRATHSPFDGSNPNTFMGSFLASLAPYTTKISNLSSGVTSLTQFTTSSFASLVPQTSAQDPNAKYNICQDTEYKELELATDGFCNVRHGLKTETLAMDSTTVVDYMVSRDYVDEETGEPKDSDNDYAEYIKNCMNRSTSIGGFTEENDNNGKECVQGSASGAEETKRNMFRLFWIDMSINEGLENGMANSDGAAANAQENGKVVSPVTSNPTITSGYGPRGSIGDAGAASTWHAGIDIVAKPTDVVAAMAGEVISAGTGKANTVTIRHADGLKTLYLHMYKKDVLVKVGDKVTAGQKIGKIGCAGEDPDPRKSICSGDHLHFNIWIDEVKDKGKYSKYKTAPTISGGSAGVAINPANFLTDNGVSGYKGAVNGN